MKEGDRIIGYAKAVDTDKSTYFCKDKGLIFSPGDVVFLNGINGWVEIVAFNRKKIEKIETAHDKNSGIKFYNEGVRLFQKNCIIEKKYSTTIIEHEKNLKRGKMNLDEKLEKARVIHLKGVDFYKNRELRNALICFKEAIEFVPELTVSQMMATIVYLELDDISKAKYHAQIALQHKDQLKPEEIVQLESVVNL